MKVLILATVYLAACVVAQQRQHQQYQQQQQQQQQQQPHQRQLHAVHIEEQQHQQQQQQQAHQRQSQPQREHQYDPTTSTTWIPILAYNKEQGQDGSYKASYKTGNNIDAQETGFIKDINEKTPNGVLVQHGEYQYEAPDGQVVKVEYTADEHGFRATGDHIPTSPPIPLEIQKGLEQIYDGIKKNAELNAQRAKSDPEFAKKQEARAQADYYGHYVP